jgi:hypothetical protein
MKQSDQYATCEIDYHFRLFGRPSNSTLSTLFRKVNFLAITFRDSNIINDQENGRRGEAENERETTPVNAFPHFSFWDGRGSIERKKPLDPGAQQFMQIKLLLSKWRIVLGSVGVEDIVLNLSRKSAS